MIAFVFQPRRGGRKARLWSARIRLDGWAAPKTIPLKVSDKRVATQKLQEHVRELEREAAGLSTPRTAREAAQTPIAGHLAAFLKDVEARGRSAATVRTYRKVIGKACTRCGWERLRDITPRSFTQWRALGEVGPKFANDVLGDVNAFLNWLVAQRLLVDNPLKEVERVTLKPGRGYRRSLTADEVGRLLSVASKRRATLYLIALYTGLRRTELLRITWGDIDLDGVPPSIRVPASITKNGKKATLVLRPEVVAALRAFRPDLTQPFEWAFRGKVPSVDSLKRDLALAGIPFKDDAGRRFDFHAFRDTLCTHLQANGVPPRIAMELMRHSDIKLTMRVYTDAAQLPLVSELARLPSFSVPVSPLENDAQRDAQGGAQTGVATVRAETQPDAARV